MRLNSIYRVPCRSSIFQVKRLKCSRLNKVVLIPFAAFYSIVNAERVVNNTSNDDSLILFNDIISYLNRKRQLSGILVEGMYLKNVKIVLENVVNGRIPYQRLPFAGKPNPDLDEFWKEIQRFLEEKPHRAVILSLSGVHDHFTVIRSITDRQMQLFRLQCLVPH